MKIFILWIMLSSHGITLSNHEYDSLEACNIAKAQVQKEFTQGGDWGEYAVRVKATCTPKE